MVLKNELLQILVKSKNNVRKQIDLNLKTLSVQNPNLGIGAGGDPIKEVDLIAEKAIVNTFKKYKMSFTLISEESGIKEFGQTPNQYYVTIDPIDGTANLTKGIPFYATSIAISTEPFLSTVYAALVADLFHDTTYTAQKGIGAYRNNQKITPSKNTSLKEAMIGLDLNSYKVEKIAPQVTCLIQKAKHIRHFGANALEICYVADGTSDAFIDIRGKLRTTDVAGAWLIVQEAGGKITTAKGKPLNAKLDPRQRVEFVAAANEGIHRVILGMIK